MKVVQLTISAFRYLLIVMLYSLMHHGWATGLVLPAPAATKFAPSVITIRDAVLLSLRNSPDVEASKLARVSAKYTLMSARYNYLPQFSLGGNATYNQGSKPNYTLNPGVGITNSRFGTTGSVNYAESFNGGQSGATFNITQPLWGGFSPTKNLAELYNAEEAAVIAKYMYRDAIVNQIHSTTQAYRALVLGKQQLHNDVVMLGTDNTQLKHAKLKLKLGRGTQYDVTQSQLNISNDQETIVQDREAIAADRAILDKALGLRPGFVMHISSKINMPKVMTLSLKRSEALILQADTSYLQAQIDLKVAKRALASARDDARPTFNYTYSKGTSVGASNVFALNIPIHNVSNKASIIEARIAVINDQNNVITVRNNLINKITLDYHTVHNNAKSLELTQQSYRLNLITVKQQSAQYKAGKLSLYTLSDARQQLSAKQSGLQNSQNALWSALETYRTDIGAVLKYWGIQLKY